MSERNELELTLADHKKAFTEIAFLLEMFSRTIKDVVGGGSSTVCRNAGRNTARKLPIYLASPTLETAVHAVLDHLRPGFDAVALCEGRAADLEVTTCAIREVCADRGQEPGGELCSMFHWYLGGIVNEITGKQTRSTIPSAAATRCTARLEQL